MYEFPLRLPSNLALVLRVATVVEGVCVTLDPDFDFIDVATSYLGEQGYIEEGVREYVGDRRDQLREASGAALRVPPKLESALDRIERKNLVVQAELEDTHDHFDQLARRVVLGVAFGAGIVSTTLLYTLATVEATVIAGGGTVLCGFVLYWSFRRSKAISAEPKFTRHQMRQRERDDDTATLGFGDANAAKSPELSLNGDQDRGRDEDGDDDERDQ